LGILAARLGHYVRNSLVAVRTFLDLAPEKLLEEKIDADHMRNPNFWKEFYEQAQGQIRRITVLLSDIMSATEKSDVPTTTQELYLDKTVTGSVERLQTMLLQNGITVVNQIPTGLPPLWVDRDKFQRLFDLLLKDEIISLPPGSNIFVGASMSSAAAEEIQIEVRDDGPGLPREALRSVFDPFVLTRGSCQEFGINLMACYFIIYHHGGRIDVQNREGQGVTFTLTFPLQPKVTSPADDEEAFITKVLINDAFWERLISGQE
jgi:signal transduction histidine kinase